MVQPIDSSGVQLYIFLSLLMFFDAQNFDPIALRLQNLYSVKRDDSLYNSILQNSNCDELIVARNRNYILVSSIEIWSVLHGGSGAIPVVPWIYLHSSAGGVFPFSAE